MRDFNHQLNIALNFHKNNNIRKALDIYLDIYNKEKKNINLLYLIGTSYIQIKKIELSVKFFEQVLKIEKNHLQSLNNLGGAYYELNRHEEAIEIFKKLLKLNPNNKNAKNNLANCYTALKRYEKALKLYQEILNENSKDYIVHNNIGNIYRDLKNYEFAIKSYKESIKINSKFTLAYNNLGEILNYLGLFEDSLKMYNQVLKLDQEYKNITSKIIHTKQKICDWENFENLKIKLLNDIKNFKQVNPFSTLSLTNNPKIQKICSETFIKKKFGDLEIKKSNLKTFNKKLKIAYFSSDFKNHPVLHLSLDIFKNHDKTKFEIYGFSLLKNKKDEWNQNIENYFTEFFYVNDKSDDEIAYMTKKIGIDISIDLNGFTNDGRQGIFYKRSAPIQINFLGYPGTMGANFYDYIIADRTIIPESKKDNYTEKIIYQENCYQPNISKREVSKKILKKSDFNLPEEKLIYCNFNSNYKITPFIFKTWMEILNEVPNSVFWIYCNNEIAETNILKEAKLNNIDEKRLIFAKKVKIQEHLKRLKLADIFLDTFPYGAHTTASDAVRMGLPIVTIEGETFASRVSSSILKQVNLKELIATNIQNYKKLAIKFGKNKDFQKKINKKLSDSLNKTLLFDSKRFTKNLENNYIKVIKSHEKN